MDTITLKAYAKINLTLDVTGIKDNGYHLLKMVMQSVDLYDTVTVSKSDKITITCDDPAVPTDRRNIVFKCAELFFKAHNLTNAGAHIDIVKRIPSQAGMAGGSSDGAAVLHALNKLYDIGCSDDELCKLGVEIGADIPFCIKGGTLLAEGVGEILSPLPPLCKAYIAVAKPAEGVETPNAFAEYDRVGALNRPDHPKMLAALTAGDLNQIGQNLCNVLEDVCAPESALKIKSDMLKLGALGSVMTGSGSAVFGLFPDFGSAQNCTDKLDLPFKTVCTPVLSGVEQITE